ncbi:MAG: hypothetical protein K2L80_07450 [Muribaculaceae bacterium]|nr:hypothetical protein [Muribaculaceae bacterium]
MTDKSTSAAKLPSVALSAVPIAFLLLTIVCIMVVFGSDKVSEVSPLVLLGASVLAVVLSVLSRT